MTKEEFSREILVFKNKLFRFGLRFLNNTEEAADAVQEVYLKLWNMRDQLHQYNNKEAFAMTMIKNHCLDQLKSKNRKHLSLGNYDSTASEASSPEKITELKDEVSIAEYYINQLPHLQKIIMQLRDIELYEFEEIASITGISLNAIRVNLSRARKQVREQIIQHNSYEYQKY